MQTSILFNFSRDPELYISLKPGETVQYSVLSFYEHILIGGNVQSRFILLLLNKATCKIVVAMYMIHIMQYQIQIYL